MIYLKAGGAKNLMIPLRYIAYYKIVEEILVLAWESERQRGKTQSLIALGGNKRQLSKSGQAKAKDLYLVLFELGRA